jgi:hypothetical protein
MTTRKTQLAGEQAAQRGGQNREKVSALHVLRRCAATRKGGDARRGFSGDRSRQSQASPRAL